MKIIDELLLIKQSNDYNSEKSAEFEKALQQYDKLIKEGYTKPRGFCLSTVSDSTRINYDLGNLSNK